MTPHDSTRCAECGGVRFIRGVCVKCVPLTTPSDEVGTGGASEAQAIAYAYLEVGGLGDVLPDARAMARAYLALLEQVATLTDRLAAQSGWDENERIAALEAELAALRAPVPSGVTEAMVERFIAAMDVASDADVGREEGIRYALLAALAEAV